MKTIHLNAIMTNNQGRRVDNESTYVFDKIVAKTTTIEYDSTTGIVTFLQPGLYFVECVVSTNASSTVAAVVTWINSDALPEAVESSSAQKIGQTYNSTIINVETVPATMYVTNNSNASIVMSPMFTQGSLLVYALDAPTPYFEAMLNGKASSIINNLEIVGEEINLTLSEHTIPFDTVVHYNTASITYDADAASGVFTLQPGSYQINWWINAFNVDNRFMNNLNTAILELRVNGTAQSMEVLAYSSMTMITSMVNSGYFIVNVTEPDTAVSLTFPVQESFFQYGGARSQAGVIFTQLA